MRILGRSDVQFFMTMILLPVMTIVGAAAFAESLADRISNDEWTRLKADKVVLVKKGKKDADGNISAEGRALVLVNRPRKAVWNCLCDYAKHPEFMPHVVNVECYFQEGNKIGLKQTIKVLFTKYSYHVMQNLDLDNCVLEWTLDKSKPNDIKDTHGSWRMEAYGEDKTLVCYTLNVDSGVHIAKFLSDFLLNQSLPGVVKALKDRVESQEAYRKSESEAIPSPETQP